MAEEFQPKIDELLKDPEIKKAYELFTGKIEFNMILAFKYLVNRQNPLKKGRRANCADFGESNANTPYCCIIFIIIMAVYHASNHFSDSWYWQGGVEELNSYMVLWLCFLELPNITHREITVRVDLIIMHLRPAAQKALRVITNTVCMCILLLLAYKDCKLFIYPMKSIV
jgi:hypothetical protein